MVLVGILCRALGKERWSWPFQGFRGLGIHACFVCSFVCSLLFVSGLLCLLYLLAASAANLLSLLSCVFFFWRFGVELCGLGRFAWVGRRVFRVWGLRVKGQPLEAHRVYRPTPEA